MTQLLLRVKPRERLPHVKQDDKHCYQKRPPCDGKRDGPRGVIVKGRVDGDWLVLDGPCGGRRRVTWGQCLVSTRVVLQGNQAHGAVPSRPRGGGIRASGRMQKH
eukprot:1638880-Rhodomonas_salina.1